jgi:predicted RNA-binding protein YlxR (DUF448 family)
MSRPPVRTCVGCRTACPAAELVRLVAPDGVVRVARRGPGQGAMGKRGRGTWVHPRCLVQALTTAALGRAFRRQVEITDREALLAQAHSAHGRSTDVQGDPP